MTTHDLKTWPAYFAAVERGHKTFEIRENDRGFAVGDILLLREWVPPPLDLDGTTLVGGGYTGRSCTRTVTYLTDFGQRPGFVVLAMKP